MIFLLWAEAEAEADAEAVDVLDVVRQKGELELDGLCQRLHWRWHWHWHWHCTALALRAGRSRLTQSGLLAATRLLATGTSLLCMRCYDG